MTTPEQTFRQEYNTPSSEAIHNELPQSRETLSPTTSELKNPTPNDSIQLTQIKKAFDDWTQYGFLVDFKQALSLSSNDRPKSNLVKDKDIVDKIKQSVSQICQNLNTTPSYVFNFSWVTDYPETVLSQVDNSESHLNNTQLKKLSANYPGIENQTTRLLIIEAINHQSLNRAQINSLLEQLKSQTQISLELIQEAINKIIPEPKQKLQTPKKENSDPEQKPNRPKTIKLERLPKPDLRNDPVQKYLRTLKITEHLFQNHPFSKQFDFYHALRLIHPDYELSENLPAGFDGQAKQTLKQWFKRILSAQGIKDIERIDVDMAQTVTQMNPNLIPYISSQPTNSSLDIKTVKSIVKTFPYKQNFCIQKLFAELFFSQSLDQEHLNDFLKSTKSMIIPQTKEKGQRALLRTIYGLYCYDHQLPSSQITWFIPNLREIRIPNKLLKLSTKPEKNKSPKKHQTERKLSPDQKMIAKLKAYAIRLKTTNQRLEKTIADQKLINDWWNDPKYNVSSAEKAAFNYIMAGGDPYSYAEINGITIEQFFTLLKAGWSRQHLYLTAKRRHHNSSN